MVEIDAIDDPSDIKSKTQKMESEPESSFIEIMESINKLSKRISLTKQSDHQRLCLLTKYKNESDAKDKVIDELKAQLISYLKLISNQQKQLILVNEIGKKKNDFETENQLLRKEMEMKLKTVRSELEEQLMMCSRENKSLKNQLSMKTDQLEEEQKRREFITSNYEKEINCVKKEADSRIAEVTAKLNLYYESLINLEKEKKQWNNTQKFAQNKAYAVHSNPKSMQQSHGKRKVSIIKETVKMSGVIVGVKKSEKSKKKKFSNPHEDYFDTIYKD